MNGAPVIDLADRIDDDAQVTLDDRPIDLSWRTRVRLFHKPAGLIVAAHDPEGQGTVFDAFQAALAADERDFGWHAVGRLDRATTGLLLFTNDEAFVDHATRPETHVAKTYVATVDGPLIASVCARLVAGVVIEDGAARALSARVAGDRTIELVVDEGRHHLVRRMLNAVQLSVLTLERKAVGRLVLDVAIGSSRVVTDDELRTLLQFEPRAG